MSGMVTDPAVLAQLNAPDEPAAIPSKVPLMLDMGGGVTYGAVLPIAPMPPPAGKKVVDPSLLAGLNGPSVPLAASHGPYKGPESDPSAPGLGITDAGVIDTATAPAAPGFGTINARPPGVAAAPWYMPETNYVRDARTDEEHAQVNAAFVAGLPTDGTWDPTKASEVVKYASMFGTTDYAGIEKNLPYYKYMEKHLNFDYAKFEVEHPVLAKFVGNPTIGAAVLGQSAAYSRLEDAIRPLGFMPPKNWIPPSGREQDAAKYQDEGILTGAEAPDKFKPLYLNPAWVDTLTKAWVFQPAQLVVQAAKIGSELVGNQGSEANLQRERVIDTLSALSSRDVVGDASKASYWAQQGLLLPLAWSSMLAGGGGAMKAGGKIGMGLFNFAYLTPGTVDRFSRMTDPTTGERVAPWLALAAGVPTAAVGAAAMTVSFAGPTGRLLELYGAAASKGVSEGLAEAGVSGLLAGFAKTYGSEVAHGALGMTLQGASDELGAQILAKSAFGTPMSADELGRATKESFLTGLRDMAMFAGWSGGAQALGKLGRMHAARDTFKRNLDAKEAWDATDHAITSIIAKDVSRQPNASTHQFIEISAVEKQAERLGVDPRTVITEVTGSAEAWDKAKETGATDVQIPVESMGKLYKSKSWGDFAVMNAKYDPIGLSPEGVARVNEEINKRADAAYIEPPNEQIKLELEAIKKDVTDKVLAAHKGKANEASGPETAALMAELTAKAALRMHYLTDEQSSPILFYDKYFAPTAFRVGEVRVGGAASDAAGSFSFPRLDGMVVPTMEKTAITITPTARPGTAPHEFIHQLLHSYFSAQVDHPELAKEHDALAKAMGYASGDERFTNRDPKKEERLTYAFELYLLEGQPPDPALADVFARIKASMTQYAEAGKGITPLSADPVEALRFNIAQTAGRAVGDIGSAPGWGGSAVTKAHVDSILTPDIRDTFNITFAAQEAVAAAAKEAGLTLRLQGLADLIKEKTASKTLPEGVRLEVKHNKEIGSIQIKAFDKEGNNVGSVLFGRHKDGTISAAGLSVNEEFQRQGIASAMYAEAEKITGATIVPSKVQTPDGEAFWTSRSPTGAALAESTGERPTVDAARQARENLLEWIREGTRKINNERFKGERASFAKDAEAKQAQDPAQKALAFLGGKSIGGTVDQSVMEEMYGKRPRILASSVEAVLKGYRSADIMQKITEKHGQVFTTNAETGLPIEDLAQLVGAKSGKELLAKVLKAPTPEEYVKTRVDQKMLDKYGGFLLGGGSKDFVEQAMESAHDPKMAQRMFAEVRAMQAKLDPSRNARAVNLDEAGLKALADSILAKESINGIDPHVYVRNERSNANKVIEHLDAGDINKAYDYQEARLLGFYLYRGAKTMEKSFDKALAVLADHAAETAWRRTLGKESEHYLNANDTALKALGIMEKAPGEVLDPTVIDRLIEEAASRDQPTSMFEAPALKALISGEKQWGDLTPAEAKGVFGAIKAIRMLANEAREIRRGEAKAEVDAIIADSAEYTAVLKDKPLLPTDAMLRENPHVLVRAMRAWNPNLLEPRVWLKRLGPGVYSTVWDGLVLARDAQEKMQDVTGKKFTDMFEAWAGRGDRAQIVLGLGETLPMRGDTGPKSKMWLMNVALWFGNEAGRQRLLDYTGWNSSQVVEAFGKYLTHDDLAFVDRVHKLMDVDLYPLEDAHFFRRYGEHLPKKQAIGYEVTFADGSTHAYEGGYNKLGYSNLTPLPINMDAPGGRGYVATSRGYEMDISPGANRMPDLSWDLIPKHVFEVIHNVTFGDWVHDAQKVLMDPRMQQIIATKLGPGFVLQSRALLEAAAYDSAMNVPGNLREIALAEGWGRSILVMGALGFGIRPVIADIINPLMTSVIRQGVKFTVTEMAPVQAKVLYSRAMSIGRVDPLYADALSKSTELQHRNQHASKTLRDIIGMPGDAPDAQVTAFLKSARNSIHVAAFWMIEAMDRTTSHMLWRAPYEAALARGMTEEAARQAGNENVQAAQPTHLLAEMPAFMRSKTFAGAMTIFYGYNSKLYQMGAESHHELVSRYANDPEVSATSKAWRVAQHTGRMIGMLGSGYIAAQWIMGHGRRDDESWGQWWARRALVAPLSTLPLVPDVAEPVVADLVHGKPPSLGTALRPPGYSMIFNAVQTLGRLAQSEREPSKKVWDATEFLLLATGNPAFQPRKTAEYVTDVARGKEKPKGPGEFVHKTLFGESSRESSPFWSPPPK